MRQAASADYFRLMGIPVLQGRGVTEQDTESNAWVVVINEAMAKQYWKDQDPLRQRIVIGASMGPDFAQSPREVIGVIADAANYVEAGRDTWCRAADRAGVEVRIIEVVCSDEAVHRKRLEDRERNLEGYLEPTWDEVTRRRAEVEHDIETALGRLRARGVPTDGRFAETFFTEQRATQYLVAQALACRGSTDIALP